jgi:outer membrane immunogenic protein
MERSRRWLKKLTFAVFAISFLATLSYAQDTPAADVAVEYSPLYIVKGFTIWMNGGSGSVAFNANKWFGVAGDFGGYVGHIPQSLTGATYMVGPRFSYRKLDRLVPFAQALFGGSHFSKSSGGITGGGNEFAFALGGGGDFGLGGSRKFGLRLEGDYFGIRSSGSTTPSVRLSVGIVYRIGKK